MEGPLMSSVVHVIPPRIGVLACQALPQRAHYQPRTQRQLSFGCAQDYAAAVGVSLTGFNMDGNAGVQTAQTKPKARVGGDP